MNYMNDIRTIEVTGGAKLSFAPDRIIVLLDYEKRNNNYKKAIEEANKVTVYVKDKAEEAGLSRDIVKTKEYLVSPYYEYEKDEKGNYHHVQYGYIGKASFAIDIPFDNTILCSLLSNIEESGLRVSFDFSISNIEDCMDKVIEKATEDAIHKANTIAKASHIQLKRIVNISHMNLFEIMNDLMCCSTKGAQADFTPADLELEDKVNITWEIE